MSPHATTATGAAGSYSRLDTSQAGLLAEDHEVSRVRFKSKRVFEGSFGDDGQVSGAPMGFRALAALVPVWLRGDKLSSS